MSSTSWNPFPLSWKQRLAVIAWILYLLSLAMKVWKRFDGFQLHLAFFGPPGDAPIDFFSGLLIALLTYFPSLPIFLSAAHSFHLSQSLETHQETAVHLSLFSCAGPVLLVVLLYPGHQPGFFVWWAAVILASVSLGMKTLPKARGPFQFRLSTLVMLSLVSALCLYLNLLFHDAQAKSWNLGIRIPLSLLFLGLGFDLFERLGTLLDTRRKL